MEAIQKITVHVPRKLLQKARKATHSGITPTIRKGLELLAAGNAYDDLMALRGKLNFQFDYEKFRKEEE